MNGAIASFHVQRAVHLNKDHISLASPIGAVIVFLYFFPPPRRNRALLVEGFGFTFAGPAPVRVDFPAEDFGFLLASTYFLPVDIVCSKAIPTGESPLERPAIFDKPLRNRETLDG